MTEELDSTEGISRRDMLQKSALIGGAGALAWAAPSITKYGGAAFGDSNGTPVGKGISYIAIRYSCVGEDGPFRYIKFDDYDEATGWNVQSGPNLAGGGPGKGDPTPGCDTGWADDDTDPGPYDDSAKFSFSNLVVVDGDVVSVKVCLTGATNGDCLIDGVGFAKCGAPQVDASGGECLEVDPVGNCLTFSDCGF